MKNAGMAGAVALVGIGLIIIGLGNFVQTPQAIAAPVVQDEGETDPVIVAFGSMGLALDGYGAQYATTGFYRLWSDGRIECRMFEPRRPSDVACGSPFILDYANCPVSDTSDTGWFELPPAPGGDGFACRSDVNGDRQVDGADLGVLLAQWGQDVSCDPQPTYPCFDLGNLNGQVAFK